VLQSCCLFFSIRIAAISAKGATHTSLGQRPR
jgi:hypothetical protein